MAIKPFAIQRRMMELGRVRLGEKGQKGEPKKLDRFRFTSASKALLDALAAKYGGEVKAWDGADEGYFEVYTDAKQVDIVLPPVFSDADGEPTYPFSQWFEQWSGGGCTRRCDGETEMLSGKPCMCNPDERACKPTTRVSFMMPDLPGLGVWRVESHGYNVAAEMPGTINVLANAAAEGKFIPAVLRLEPRTSKKAGQTRKFVVPVIDLPNVTVNEIASGTMPLAINAPKPNPPRPELPAGPAPVAEEFGDVEEGAGWGEQIEPEVLAEKPKAADKRKLTAAISALAEAAPDKDGVPTDWALTANNLMRRRFDVDIDDASRDQVVELTGALEKHLESLKAPA